MSYTRILLPVDGSEHSQRALAHAAGLAQNWAKVFVINVVPEIPAVIGGEPRKEAEIAVIDDTRLITDPVRRDLERKGVRHEVEILFDNSIPDAITKAAQEHKCDLIVMGTRGLSDLKGLFLGSVTHEVLTLSSVPVLVVH